MQNRKLTAEDIVNLNKISEYREEGWYAKQICNDLGLTPGQMNHLMVMASEQGIRIAPIGFEKRTRRYKTCTKCKFRRIDKKVPEDICAKCFFSTAPAPINRSRIINFGE